MVKFVGSLLRNTLIFDEMSVCITRQTKTLLEASLKEEFIQNTVIFHRNHADSENKNHRLWSGSIRWRHNYNSGRKTCARTLIVDSAKTEMIPYTRRPTGDHYIIEQTQLNPKHSREIEEDNNCIHWERL